jgi:hypothetical protein
VCYKDFLRISALWVRRETSRISNPCTPKPSYKLLYYSNKHCRESVVFGELNAILRGFTSGIG